MQNVQNASEIQQRVINLVELYRTKVGKESLAAKDLAEKYKYKDLPDIDIPTEDKNKLRVNEQLLGYFYAIVAGDNADIRVLQELLPNHFNSTVFSEEEVCFLKEHFKEMVNYIIKTPTFDLSELGMWTLNMNFFLIPEEILELIKNRMEIPAGSIVYNPFTCLAQFPLIYKDSSFLCEESYVNYNRQIHEDKALLLWAWMKVAIYANKMDATIIEDGRIPSSYDSVISFIPFIPHAVIDGVYDNESGIYDSNVVSKIIDSYNHLRQGGKMGLLIPSDFLQNINEKSPLKELWDKLLSEGTIEEIIQLPYVIEAYGEVFSIIIAEKGLKSNFATMIDARFATMDKRNMDVSQHTKALKYFSNEKFAEMVKNDGIDNVTGLRKLIHIDHSLLKTELLAPQVYVVEKPIIEDSPIPLSKAGCLITTLIRDVQFDLPEDTPWITTSDITPLYTGDLDLTGIRKANCPNNPTFAENSEDYEFSSSGKFIDNFWAQTEKGCHVLDYRQCSFLDGNSDIVLYERSAKHIVRVAVVRATGKPYAVSRGILVFCPKDGFDAYSLAALLRLPIVYRQLMAYQEYGLDNYLNEILVPTDKRIIGDELYRMEKEKSVTDELGEKVQAMKTEYINEVRMRKHDMGQKVFDLINTEDLMRYYVENREIESDVWFQIEEQLDHFRSTIHELSEMLDHLSQEEQFGNPELLDLNDYLANLQHSNNVNGFTLSYQLDRDSILDLQLSHMKERGIKDMNTVMARPTVFMAKNDLQRVVSNILSNAQIHGFVDPNRMDYEVNIRLEFNAEKGMYQIDFRNNGKPIPEGLNKMRYGIKGEKAGRTAGTGLGGSVVKSIIKHYKGDYDVLKDGDWTVIRVYLPIAI